VSAGESRFFRDLSVIKFSDNTFCADQITVGLRADAVLTRSGRVGILASVTDLPDGATWYFEDYVPGLTVDCGSFSLSEAEIIAFAKEYDPQPFHTDPVGAADGPFGGLIASGWQTTSLMMRLLVEHFVSPRTSLGAAGVDEIRWPRPVRPGDTLHVRATVLEARRSQSKLDRGIVKSLAEVTNQRGETVMRVTAINFVLARNPEGEG
jgi:acyl dehydratase